MEEKKEKIFDIKTVKFLIVGVLNTIVGMGTMFLLYNLWLYRYDNVGYWISSACNYVVGCIVSYFLNKYWTFGDKEKSFKKVLKFVLMVAVCYLISYGIAEPVVKLILSGQSVKLQENIAMLCGAGLYTVLNYFGQRFFAFKKDSKKEETKEEQ